MKLVCFVGVFDSPTAKECLWENVQAAFQNSLPITSVVVARTFYTPLQRDRMQRYAKKTLISTDTGEDVILVGYSMGGVLARSVAPFFRSTVRCVVTIASPHRLHTLFVRPYQRFAGPLLSVHCSQDWWVPPLTTYLPGAEMCSIESGHLLSLIREPYLLQIVAEKAASLLKTTNRP